MPRLRMFGTLLAVLATFALAAPVAALADGSGSSAGDQQYVDPLGGHSGSSSGQSSGTSSTSSTPSVTPSVTPSPTTTSPTATTAAATATATTSSTSQTPSGTLPYTGLALWPCTAIGIGFLASGIALRRFARRTQ